MANSKKILIAVDLSAQSLNPVRYVAQQCDPADLRVNLMCVMPTAPATFQDLERDAFFKEKMKARYVQWKSDPGIRFPLKWIGNRTCPKDFSWQLKIIWLSQTTWKKPQSGFSEGGFALDCKCENHRYNLQFSSIFIVLQISIFLHFCFHSTCCGCLFRSTT